MCVISIKNCNKGKLNYIIYEHVLLLGIPTMPAWRKKIDRTICIDTTKLVCGCMWPVKLTKSELRKLEKVTLYDDELQALAYKDLENLTMKESAKMMWISKTVFAGIYSSARKKQTDCLVNWKIIIVQCDD